MALFCYKNLSYFVMFNIGGKKMKLKELLNEIGILFEDDIDIKGITCNSKEVKKDFLFVAIRGNNHNANDYIEDAKKRKAAYIISDSVEGDKILKVENIKEMKANLFYKFYNYPQNKLQIIAVTGTNGKTSTAYIIYNLLNKLSKKCMYIGTLGIYDDSYYKNSRNTTPDSDFLAEEFAKAVKRKTKYVVMEVSSHSLALNRIKLIDFKGAIFTNLTHEHLDYHITMSNYCLTKQKLFNNLKEDRFAIINYDDKYHFEMEKFCRAKIIHYGLEFNENHITNISRSLEGICFDLGKYEKISSKLLGVINVYNLSAAFLTLKELGFEEDEIKEAIKYVDTIKGRLEKIYNNKFCVILDYAHTPDAMEKVLVEIKPMVTNRLIVMFGCGGNRDTTKRPIMGEIATTYGDVVYVTSDNPRHEEPLLIIKDILKGCKNEKKIVIEENRELALRKAIAEIQAGDILMVLGKGHEEYQIIGDEYIEYSDKKMIFKWLQI